MHFNEENKNHLYAPNEALLREIEDSKKIREFEHLERQRIRERNMLQQHVEEISPSGVKRSIEVHPGLTHSNIKTMADQSAPMQGSIVSKAPNPFAEEQDQDHGMFNMQMDASQNNLENQDPNCRDNLPDRQFDFRPHIEYHEPEFNQDGDQMEH